MTDPTVIAASAAVFVASVATATVAIMKQQTAGKLEILVATAKAAAENAEQAKSLMAIEKKVDVVEHQTNSIHTAQQATIADQEVQIRQLQEAINRMEKLTLSLAGAAGRGQAVDSAP